MTMHRPFPLCSIGHLFNQPGNHSQHEVDPAKAAAAIIQITQLGNPPLRLPLGRIAINTITSKLESVQTDLDNWRAVAERAVW